MPVQGANKASSQGWKKLTENSVVWFALGMIVTGVLGTVAWLAWLDGHIEGQIKTSDTVKKISLSVEEALKKSDVLFAQALKKRDVVFAQCSGGNCFESKAGTANCPEGKIIRSGVW
ncbi:MAG: hypothetical protein JO122_10440, partial [Acetobacteraceae bacterium]|nr:hypothetical protein [Acetobacteraceae bacterium]